MRYNAVQNGLTLTVAYVKNWLKVDESADDTLIQDLIDIAKEVADNYLQNDFKVVQDEEVGTGDDSTLIFNLDHDDIIDRSLELWLLNEGVDPHEAALNLSKYGSLMTQSEDDADHDYDLNLSTGVITFESTSVPDHGEIVYARKYRLNTALSIPATIKMGILKLIAYLYENRTGGLESESISGLESVKFKVSGILIPEDVIALWAAYRRNPGL